MDTTKSARHRRPHLPGASRRVARNLVENARDRSVTDADLRSILRDAAPTVAEADGVGAMLAMALPSHLWGSMWVKVGSVAVAAIESIDRKAQGG